MTKPMPGTLTAREIEDCLSATAALKGGDDLYRADIVRALTELRSRRAEEAQRKGVEGFEEMAGAWLKEVHDAMMACTFEGPSTIPTPYKTEAEWLASLLASVHKAGMEKAAGIAHDVCLTNSRVGDEEGWGTVMGQDIEAAIRRAAAEK